MESTGVDYVSDTWSVHVPAKFSGKTEGLCGLADGEISNDLWVGTYAVASVSASASVSADTIGSFFNHWLVNNGASANALATIDATCLADASVGTELIAGGGSALARTFCTKIFSGDVFAELSSLVDTSEYIDTCVRATAGLPIPRADATISSTWPGCSVFAAYAEAGARQGKCVDWRSDSFCSYSSCTGDCTYKACGPSIQTTTLRPMRA